MTMNRISGAKIFIDEAFHIHTVRCGHASADPAEAYVQEACRLGLKRVTFTDHGPFPGNPFSERMRMEELDGYEKELKALRKQYDGRIDIRIGLEIEYLPEYRGYYEMLHERFDLLLLGQHHTSLPDGRYTFDAAVSKALAYHRLIESIPEAIETGLFSAVAHPERDFHEDDRWTEKDTEIKNAIFAAALQHHVKAERNAALMESGGKHQRFWQDIPEQIMMVYGVDAHCPEDIGRRIQLLKTAANE
jgi:histidinol-phosphatase (PHP family)